MSEIAKSYKDALRHKTPRYRGTDCLHHHGGVRWTKTRICVACNRQYAKAYRERPGVAQSERIKNRDRARSIRIQVLNEYGNKCTCPGCLVTESEFLALDHINGDGKLERAKHGNSFYRHVIRLGFPKDRYRLLCHNCNTSYGLYGRCPHQNLFAKVVQ